MQFHIVYLQKLRKIVPIIVLLFFIKKAKISYEGLPFAFEDEIFNFKCQTCPSLQISDCTLDHESHLTAALYFK